MELSPSETKVLKILTAAKGKPLTSDTIMTRYYAGKNQPEHARVIIAGVLRSLAKKTARQSIKVKRSARKGPHPMSAWIEGV